MQSFFLHLCVIKVKLMKFRFYILVLALFTIFSCKAKIISVDKNYEFPKITVPTMYSEDNIGAIGYLVTNYWNNYLDSNRINDVIKIKDINKDLSWGVLGLDTTKFEEAFGEYSYYLNLLQPLDYKKVDLSIRKLIRAADNIALRGDSSLMMNLLEFTEKYFYDANSPVLNEEIYIPALEEIMAARSISNLDKIQFEWQLKICSMNRKGQVVPNFDFMEKPINSSALKKSNLNSIKANYTLIFFNNPDCPACSDYKDFLINDPTISSLIKGGKIKVLSLFIDKEVDLWKSYRSTYPSNWIYSYDHNFVIRENEYFAVRAIPSLYLLDKDKRVLLKDADTNKLLNYLIKQESTN